MSSLLFSQNFYPQLQTVKAHLKMLKETMSVFKVCSYLLGRHLMSARNYRNLKVIALGEWCRRVSKIIQMTAKGKKLPFYNFRVRGKILNCIALKSQR